MKRVARFSDGSTMEISIPEGSDLLERVRAHADKSSVEEVTDFDIGLFVTQATSQALTKRLTEMLPDEE